MDQQQLHQKLGEANQHMYKECILSDMYKQHASDCSQAIRYCASNSCTNTTEKADSLASKRTKRFCINARKDYRRALFQAALNGDLTTLDALTEQVELTQNLIDEDSCNNALWVAVAENQPKFAIGLLQTPIFREKLTLKGIKDVMSLSLGPQDKTLINALLQFVASNRTQAPQSKPQTH